MFKNEAFSNFSDVQVKSSYAAALDALRSRSSAGSLYACPIINGKEIKTSSTIESYNPSTGKSIGKVYLGGIVEAEAALKSIKQGQYAWERSSPETRAAALRKTAQLLRARKYGICALITLEEGKSWPEADGDVAEGIDFCEYYANEIIRMGKPIKTDEVQGEDNFYFYSPRGQVVVISPWNFPLAIAAGMTVAALVTGNGAILKPARQSSIIAHELSKIILEAGVPADAFAFLPSPGGQVGSYLASHKDIDMICFTGSMEVGLDLIKTAGVVVPGQRNVKKVVAEMGGKNAIIVDEDADIDLAVKGTALSAFGYTGQKCSACSRLIIVGKIYEDFMKKFCEAASKISVGDVSDPSIFMGPVIDETSQKRILKVISEAEKSIKLAFKGEVGSGGYFVPPTIFRDVPSDAFIWKEELFGPVVAACNMKTFEEALDKANNCAYALTGGVFSRNTAHLNTAKREFKVGNLYLNRKITGALVNRQPFGGSRMSGVGSKAGGPDYLLQFLEPRTVTENTTALK